jgi:LmbE family N-acetylglucosaminyl deacetylase
MKHSIKFLTVLLAYIFSSCKENVTINELKIFVATENYPNDSYLDTVSNKRALVIVAHDDDDCGMSGTIAKLTSKGWDIKQLSLQNHVMAGKGKTPAYIICAGNQLILNDGYYRIGLDTMKNPYLPIPYKKIKEQFLTRKVSDSLIKIINDFKPSVIFTLDNEKGGYGHPEHIFISQLVKDLFLENKIDCQKVYQSVYTNHMETEIVDKWLAERMKKWGYPNASDLANSLYEINGMPEPTVQIGIFEQAETKMKYLMAYDEDVRKNLRKFIPYYEEFDAKTYFGLFNREFFRVMEKPNH